MVEPELQMINSQIDTATDFAIAYGMQIIGALLVLLIGFKVAGGTTILASPPAA
ncbi:MAG: hypothetical protein VW881_07205 [Alphaproteobacteria bacterium]